MPDDDAPLLDVARVRALAGARFADIRYVRETASTNDDASALLGEPGSSGVTLVAEFQSSGRGRKPGRAWIAPPGSALLFTTILPRTVDTPSLWAVPFWTALAVADGVEDATGVRVALRWPNDLDLGERKAGGILCASRVAGVTAHVACGIGLNVVRPGAPVAIDPPPAYLSDAAPHVVREEVLAAVLRAMARRLAELDDARAVARAWETRAALRGHPYRVRLDADGTVVTGHAVRIGGDGALIIDDGSGERAIRLADARVVS